MRRLASIWQLARLGDAIAAGGAIFALIFFVAPRPVVTLV